MANEDYRGNAARGPLATDAGALRARLQRVVRERPLVAVAAAGAAGALLGGLVLSRLGRLVFVAAAGYVLNELWRREGRLEVDQVIERLSADRRTRRGET